VIIMTLTTVQGNFKQAKSTVENLVGLPSDTIKCMSEQELAQVVNFAPITPPKTKNATITLKFNKTGQDTIQWKGKVTIAGGISLQGIAVTVDVGGVIQNFTLNKSGKANNGGRNKFALNASLKNGVTKQGTVNFSFNMKGDFQALLAPYGLTNASVSNVAVTVPRSFVVGSAQHYYGTDRRSPTRRRKGRPAPRRAPEDAGASGSGGGRGRARSRQVAPLEALRRRHLSRISGGAQAPALGSGIEIAPPDELPALVLHALHVDVDRGAGLAARVAHAHAIGPVLADLADRLDLGKRERREVAAAAGASEGEQAERPREAT
jgi:hypothetical protein